MQLLLFLRCSTMTVLDQDSNLQSPAGEQYIFLSSGCSVFSDGPTIECSKYDP